MDEQDIRGLNAAVQKIFNIMQKHFEVIISIIRPIQHLPDEVKAIRETVIKGFKDQTEHNTLMYIVAKQSEMSAQDAIAGIQRELLGKKVKSYKIDGERISERYQKIQEDLSNQSKSRVAQLDKHCFNVIDETYMPIHNILLEKPIMNDNLVYESLEDMHQIRLHEIEHNTDNTLKMMKQFIDSRIEYKEKISKQIHDLSSNGTKLVSIPVYVIEYEDRKSKSKKIKYVLPSSIKNNNIGNLSINEELQNLDETILENQDKISSKIKWYTNKDTIYQKLDINLRNFFNNVSDISSTFVNKSVEKSTLKKIEKTIKKDLNLIVGDTK